MRRVVLTLLREAQEGYKENEYQNPRDEQEKILFAIYQAMKGKEFTSIQEIDSFLSDESLRKLALEIAI